MMAKKKKVSTSKKVSKHLVIDAGTEPDSGRVDGRLTRGEQTREKIVRAALALFAQKGFFASSFQEIADRCDITQPGIFIHFKNKVELLDAVRKFVSRSNHAAVDAEVARGKDALERLRRHCQGNIEWAVAHPEEAQIIYLTYYHAFFDPHFSKIFPSVIGLGTERILAYVKEGAREGLFKLSMPEDETAIMIHEYLVGCFVRNLPARGSKKVTAAEQKRLEFFLKALLGQS